MTDLLNKYIKYVSKDIIWSSWTKAMLRGAEREGGRYKCIISLQPLYLEPINVQKLIMNRIYVYV